MPFQDKQAVLEDVRSIIAEQLGTELDKVTTALLDSASVTEHVRRAHVPDLCYVQSKQVAADAKFVDLGADSLDTVSSTGLKHFNFSWCLVQLA